MGLLAQGRLAACDRALAAAEPGPEVALARAWLLREQDRPAEADLELRAATPPESTASRPLVQAVLGLMLAEMGRDTQARPELVRLMDHVGEPDGDGGDLVVATVLAEMASDLDAFAEADALYEVLAGHAGSFADDPVTGISTGVVDSQLGRLAHALGRGRRAARHLDDAIEILTRSAQPLPLAHARRHLATVLRVWGDDTEWSRSLELLAQSASAYRRIGLAGRAAEAHVVLGRSDDPLATSREVLRLERREPAWTVGVGDDTAELGHQPGLGDLARLVRVPRTAVHVVDLAAGLDARTARGGTDRPWFWPQQPRAAPDAGTVALDDALTAQYLAHQSAMAARAEECSQAGDGLGAALAVAECEAMAAELEQLSSPELAPTDGVSRLARVVGTRIRLAIDTVEEALPVLGRHLRYTVRTATFCSYEPEADLVWRT